MFSSYLMEDSAKVNGIHSVDGTTQFIYLCLFLCSLTISVTEGGVLQSLTIMVYFPISSLVSTDFAASI